MHHKLPRNNQVTAHVSGVFNGVVNTAALAHEYHSITASMAHAYNNSATILQQPKLCIQAHKQIVTARAQTFIKQAQNTMQLISEVSTHTVLEMCIRPIWLLHTLPVQVQSPVIDATRHPCSACAVAPAGFAQRGLTLLECHMHG